MNPIEQMIGMMQNQAQVCQQRGLPANAFRNPETTIKQMLGSGQISQEQYNAIDAQVRQVMQDPQLMQQFQQNPTFMQLFNSLAGGR